VQPRDETVQASVGQVPPAQFYADTGEAPAEDRLEETAHARRLADRYGMEFVDLEQFQIDHDLFRTIPADLMLRYGFVPHHREGRSLVIVVSDPTDLPMIDELAPLEVSPAPDTVIRVLMDYRPLRKPVPATELELPAPPVRRGFTVVEWGGIRR